MEESERGQELYKCDHQETCHNPHCCGIEPHLKNIRSWCHVVDAYVSNILYKEKEATKKIWLIKYLHVLKTVDYVEMSFYDKSGFLLGELNHFDELIDGDLVKKTTDLDNGAFDLRVGPALKTETVEDILKDLLDIPIMNPNMNDLDFRQKMVGIIPRLKEAQEREGE